MTYALTLLTLLGFVETLAGLKVDGCINSSKRASTDLKSNTAREDSLTGAICKGA